MDKKQVVWRCEYGVYVPFCPYCGEPAYDHDICFNCGKPYEYVEGERKPKVVSKGAYTVILSTNHHISVYKNDILIFHADCGVSRSKAELLKLLEIIDSLARNEKCGAE